MSDSEDDCVTFGTALEPLDEDNLPRKKPISIEEQIVTDEKGRRRFHGAFTGGFSAGYFNSVGSRDGWKPQQFKSSRASKASNLIQRPEDYMDDEDTGEFGFAPTAIRATQQYSDQTNKGAKRERSKTDSTGPIPGTPVLKEILKPVRERVGVMLLKKMGWKPGQGIGPRLTKKEKKQKNKQQQKVKVYGCSLPDQEQKVISNQSDTSDDEDDDYANITFAPDDYEPFRCTPKDNYFGIGYSGLDRRPVLAQHINLFDAPSLQVQEKNKKLSIRGQAFGVGAFEAEDDDIYARDDMSRYDFTLEPERKAKNRWSKGDKSKPDCIEGFVPAKNQLAGKKCFPAPELPKDFKPVHKVRKSRFSPAVGEDSSRRPRYEMNAETRAQIINDDRPSIIEGRKSDSKNSSVAAKMISHALNLHGKDQIAEREKIEKSIPKKTSMSWLDKLSATSFVRGETIGTDASIQDKPQEASTFARGVSNTQFGTEMNLVKPSFPDLNKQRRFEQFLNFTESERKFKFASVQPLSMTEWERDQEFAEFEKAAKLCERIDNDTTNDVNNQKDKEAEKVDLDSLSVGDRMTAAAKMKMFGKLTRTDEEWKPAKLVCVRFNIAEPFVGVASEEKKKKKFSIFDSSVWEEMSRFEKIKQEESEPGPSTSSRFSFMDEEPDLRLKRLQESPARRKSKSEKASNKARSREVSHESRRSSRKDAEKEPEKEKAIDEDPYEKILGKKIREKNKAASDGTETVSSLSKEEPTAKLNAQEKKDLFKSIFLSSDESEPEIEENKATDDDKIKAALIGNKDAASLNTQRNTSPPKGIFAKLNFDDLFKKPDKNETSKGSSKKEDAEVSEINKEDFETKIEKSDEEELPLDTYGPALPSEAQPSLETLRPVFTLSKKEDGTWVEKSRDKKKSKKEKKKHKHKERSKSKSRKKKEKKEKRH